MSRKYLAAAGGLIVLVLAVALLTKARTLPGSSPAHLLGDSSPELTSQFGDVSTPEKGNALASVRMARSAAGTLSNARGGEYRSGRIEETSSQTSGNSTAEAGGASMSSGGDS
jgi:hypothetical protein